MSLFNKLGQLAAKAKPEFTKLGQLAAEAKQEFTKGYNEEKRESFNKQHGVTKA